MEQLEQILLIANKWLWGRWLVFVLLGLAILYTITITLFKSDILNLSLKRL